MKVAENLAAIQANIQKACENANRNEQDITLIGVTKYVTIERANEAVHAGVTHLGENRIEGLLAKKAEINNAVWHFIGSLQSRKVKEMIDEVDFIHSLDRMSLAKEINKRANKVIDCFLQVNVSGEESKHGISPDNVPTFVTELAQFENIRVAGLMTMAPYIEDEGKLRDIFGRLRNLRDEIEAKGWEHAPCHYLSMGMSNDYMLAIEEGATHIRIGSDLVGPYEE
ncbi:YggS family pyridoxal phosphate-dependent enzyme [Gracilibacillus oryzae]|uniref:Pyridoxal phosphate homeostasis protein n=1 Tax=Gracilibacillus oryzae TaxID=1672701 RepID=A0A7C8GW70_9BACI|nr:YggS family pyridoxal phosphate-dependent enzyme [Gracilibacillus oryzae]KAB8138665.1 YggS family pyridoxal phosphate-dependent enzyme [Gracilibacillus oryzae]